MTSDLKHDYSLALFNAYETEIYHRTKRLKDFKYYINKFLNSFKSKKPKDNNEDIEYLKRFAEQHGMKHPWR